MFEGRRAQTRKAWKKNAWTRMEQELETIEAIAKRASEARFKI